MPSLKSLCLLGVLVSHNALTLDEKLVDKKDTINAVALTSAKSESTRSYQGAVSELFPYPLTSVTKGITNFTDKCNNAYKDRRQFVPEGFNCKYNNDNIIESVLVRDIKKEGWKAEPDEVERYVIGRKIYNRGEYGYYELVQIFDGTNEKKQKVTRIVQTMLTDAEARLYTEPKFKKDSAFHHSLGVFTLTQLSPKETQVSYRYEAQTDHWILNKEVSVPQVFTSISKSILDLMKTVKQESLVQTRELASEK